MPVAVTTPVVDDLEQGQMEVRRPSFAHTDVEDDKDAEANHRVQKQVRLGVCMSACLCFYLSGHLSAYACV